MQFSLNKDYDLGTSMSLEMYYDLLGKSLNIISKPEFPFLSIKSLIKFYDDDNETDGILIYIFD